MKLEVTAFVGSFALLCLWNVAGLPLPAILGGNPGDPQSPTTPATLQATKTAPPFARVQEPSTAQSPAANSQSPLDNLAVARGVTTKERESSLPENELRTRDSIIAEISQYFTRYSMTRDGLADLERAANQFRVGRDRTLSGIWKLKLFYSAIANFESEDHYLGPGEDSIFHKAIQSWMEKYPNSPTPYIAKAQLLLNKAIAAATTDPAKGGGVGSAAHIQQLQRLRQFLETHRSVASIDPYWYTLMVSAVGSLGDATPAILKLVEEAAKNEPDFHETYFVATRIIGGSDTDALQHIEVLARSSLTNSRTGDGPAMYARIYWIAISELFGVEVLQHLDWSTMKIAIDAIISKYPAQWNIQHFALFACLLQDNTKTRELLDIVAVPPNMAIWRQPEMFDACNKMASTAVQK